MELQDVRDPHPYEYEYTCEDLHTRGLPIKILLRLLILIGIPVLRNRDKDSFWKILAQTAPDISQVWLGWGGSGM